MSKVITTTVDIDKKAVYQCLGYMNHTPTPFISSEIDSQIVGAYQLIKPVYTYALKAIESIKGHKVFLEDYLVLTSKTVSYVLSDCDYAAIFLSTIGFNLEEEMTKLLEKDDMLSAIILDAIGTEAIEKTADKLQGDVEGLAKTMGCRATLRYSPGYCDWNVKQQEVIFQVIDSTALDVKLTASCMMVPLKSVSGIIGIGKFDKTKPPPCVRCKKIASCPHKRIRL